ncbi:MAG: cation-translocating P-type ATPase [Verrucomicrobia bacterium]|nr:cation-translocating P-type ATPase [Verrucomicrobiota bacterium]
MKSSPGRPSERPPTRCLVEGVARILEKEPRVEAVTVRPGDASVSIATLGRREDPDLNERVKGLLAEMRAGDGAETCGLLTGKGDCSVCDNPPHESVRAQIHITQNPHATTLARVSCPTAPRFWHWKSLPLPKFVPREVDFHDDDEHFDEWKLQLLGAALCGAFTLGAVLAQPPLSLPLFLAAYLAGAWFTAKEVWELLQARRLDVHFLMLAVAAGSGAIGEWKEGAILLFLFSLAGALEHYAMGRTQKEIRALHRGAPKTATVLANDGVESERPVEKLVAGQRLLIKPGVLFPVDAEVVQGRTAVDESNMTGESAPVEKTVGDQVLAGTLNLWGAVEAVALRPASESALEKIIRLIREAQHQKAPSQRFTDRFGTRYTYAVLALTFVVFLFWWLGAGAPPMLSTPSTPSAFYRAMTLLVVASPCALVLSIPSAILAAIASAARKGVLFRGGVAVERLAEVGCVALDKTGTLTTGDLVVQSVEGFPPGCESELLALAVSLERLSTHPLARAITRHGKRLGVLPVALEAFESVTGQGLKALHAGSPVRLGRREWVCADVPEQIPIPWAEPDAGVSEVWIRGNGAVGRLVLRDELRSESRATLRALEQAGLSIVVLTGDRESAAGALRERLGLRDVRAQLTPDQKVAAIREMTAAGTRVAMVGDGVNDAPSLAAAHVGVAMGARGSDAALEQADVVLMHDRIENFLFAYQLSRRARSVIRQNLVVSLGTVLVLATLALFGVIPLTVGVIGHEGSTVLVVFNSLRLLFACQNSTPPSPG